MKTTFITFYDETKYHNASMEVYIERELDYRQKLTGHTKALVTREITDPVERETFFLKANNPAQARKAYKNCRMFVREYKPN